MVLRATVAGSAYVGVFASVIGNAVLARSGIDEARRDHIADELGVPVHLTTIGGGSTVGSLVAGNRAGLVVSGQVTPAELETLREKLDRRVAELPGQLNAAGNLVLANDTAGIVHPELSTEAVGVVEETLDIPAVRTSLGSIKTVGMAAVTTNVGVLCHPKATEEELALLDDHLGVPADIGTINHGSPLVGSGLLATENGYVVGERTTGPELGRIEDALDLVEAS